MTYRKCAVIAAAQRSFHQVPTLIWTKVQHCIHLCQVTS